MMILTKKNNLILLVLFLLGAVLVWLGLIWLHPSIVSSVETQTNKKETTKLRTVDRDSSEVFLPQEELSNEYDSKNTQKTGDDFFVEYRIEREQTRSRQLELLQEIVANPNSTSESKQEAQNQVIKTTRQLGLEMQLENLIKAKGYQDAVLVMQNESTTVVVQKKELEETDIAKIADLVSRHTGLDLSQITIIPRIDH